MKHAIHLFIFQLALIALLAAGMGCATTDNPAGDDAGTSVLEMLGREDSLTGGHVMGDAPVKEPEMAPADREYLQEQCSGCHELNRVFWTRGPRSTWEMLLSQEQHLEMKLEPADRERLHQIFQQYLSKP